MKIDDFSFGIVFKKIYPEFALFKGKKLLA